MLWSADAHSSPLIVRWASRVSGRHAGMLRVRRERVGSVNPGWQLLASGTSAAQGQCPGCHGRRNGFTRPLLPSLVQLPHLMLDNSIISMCKVVCNRTYQAQPRRGNAAPARHAGRTAPLYTATRYMQG